MRDKNTPRYERHKAHMKQYYHENKDKIAQYTKEYREKSKLELINAYGGKCSCCGECHIEFLAIDHVDKSGGVARRGGELSGWHLLRKLKKLGFPSGYRVLCHNCNSSYGYFGYCPHKQESKFLQTATERAQTG